MLDSISIIEVKMSQTYMTLLQKVSPVKKDMDFITYIMQKYDDESGYFNIINKTFIIKEDLEDLEELLANIKESNNG